MATNTSFARNVTRIAEIALQVLTSGGSPLASAPYFVMADQAKQSDDEDRLLEQLNHMGTHNFNITYVAAAGLATLRSWRTPLQREKESWGDLQGFRQMLVHESDMAVVHEAEELATALAELVLACDQRKKV